MTKQTAAKIENWLILRDRADPEARARIRASLKADTGLSAAAMSRASAAADAFWDTGTWLDYYRPYTVVGSVLIIPVEGVLLDKFPFHVAGDATGYEYIQAAFTRGMADSAVSEIWFGIDSPGGQVAGCFEMCDDIIAMKKGGGKKVVAYATGDGAYSAAYATACCADEIVVEKMSGTGSVGVVTMHVDYSKMLDRQGIAVTFIHAGEFKVEGNSFEPLSDEAKARIQKQIDKLYAIFTGHVSANRPMDEEAVRATEALTYDAEESIQVKFADRIGRMASELVNLASRSTNGVAASTGVNTMDPSLAAPEATAPAVSEAATEAAPAAVAAEPVDAKTAERARFASVMGASEYAGREALASTLLTTTDLSADQIIGALKAAAAAAAPKSGAAAFVARMDESPNPDLTASESTDGDAADEAAQARTFAEIQKRLPKR